MEPLVKGGEPIADGIREETFVSSYDATRQTYLVLEPSTDKHAAIPLVVLYLHGGTSHQDQGMTAGLYNCFYDRLWQWTKEREGVYVCPEYRGPSWMSAAAERDVVDILAELRIRYPNAKVLLTGGSMGGTSALIFAARNPGLLNGVYALCPATDMTEIFPAFAEPLIKNYGGSPDQIPEVYRCRSSRNYPRELAKLPVAIVHGDRDELIPVTHSRAIVEAMRTYNAPLQYLELAGCGHDALGPADVTSSMNFLLAGGPSA